MADATYATSPGGVIAAVVYASRLAKVLRLVRPRLAGITLGSHVYFLRERALVNDASLRHELAHVDQWHRLGVVRFLALYLWQTLRVGYQANPFEVEARAAEYP